MILQDYTGRDIRPYYPIDIHPDIQKSVLYDVTYGDGGCWIDFDTIRILKDTAGNFLQPAYLHLSEIHGKIPDAIFEKELSRRRIDLTNIHTYTCIVRGLREPSSWITEDRIRGPAAQYSRVYRVSKSDYTAILMSAIRDICAAAACSLSAEEMDTIVLSPSCAFMNLFQTLQVILKIPV